MSEPTSFDFGDPLHSLLEAATHRGYRINERVHDRLSLSSHPAPGIAATTGTGETPDNIYTGPCLMSPVDSTALKKGYLPSTYDKDSNTGEPIESYQQFTERYLHGGGIPKLSQIIDHWGMTDMSDGTVVLVLEDEEWTAKVSRLLGEAGLTPDRDQVFEDVHDAYGDNLAETFEIYVEDVLSNDVEIVPVFTSEYSEDIDEILDEATRMENVRSSFRERDHYHQRICMYTTPVWLGFLESEFGLAEGSLDISDPLRFYDEFYNYEGTELNIFREYQLDYFGSDNKNRDHDLLFVPPVLAPFDDGYTLETHASHSDSIKPQTLSSIVERLDESSSETYPNVLKHPLSRLLTGFPNHAKLAVAILRTRYEESENRPEWKDSALKTTFGEVKDDEEVQREPGVEIRSLVQEQRERVRERYANEERAGSHRLTELLFEPLTDDLRSMMAQPTGGE